MPEAIRAGWLQSKALSGVVGRRLISLLKRRSEYDGLKGELHRRGFDPAGALAAFFWGGGLQFDHNLSDLRIGFHVLVRFNYLAERERF